MFKNTLLPTPAKGVMMKLIVFQISDTHEAL